MPSFSFNFNYILVVILPNLSFDLNYNLVQSLESINSIFNICPILSLRDPQEKFKSQLKINCIIAPNLYATRISGPYGPLKILAPSQICLLPSQICSHRSKICSLCSQICSLRSQKCSLCSKESSLSSHPSLDQHHHGHRHLQQKMLPPPSM